MFVTDQIVTYADALSAEGIDYGTGYYLTLHYSDGKSDLYGPFDYEEDARELKSNY